MSTWKVSSVVWCVIALAGLITTGCGPTQAAPEEQAAPELPAPPAEMTTQTADIFTVSGPVGEEQAVRDVASALRAQAEPVRRDLEYDYRSPVRVELFADQASLDRDGMNPEMQGYYAYSGSGRIQMVSPRNPMPGLDLPYEARVGVAVHEFAHLVIGEINPQAPLWLNEGAAVYVGPHAVYRYVCEKRFPFAQIPEFAALEESYGSVRAADLFAYTAVEYIVSAYGMEKLNRLIRAPGEMETILGVSRAQFEQGWREFMEAQYTGQ